MAQQAQQSAVQAPVVALVAPKAAKAPKAERVAAEPKETIATRAAALASTARKGAGFDATALKEAAAKVAAEVRASDTELGNILLGRGRKSLRSEVAAILDPPKEDAGN